MHERKLPVCREGATEEDILREADRSVVYGACLKLLRPQTRLKPAIADAVAALLPGVQALCEGDDGPAARFALAYARACGALPFLEGKIAEYRTRQEPVTES